MAHWPERTARLLLVLVILLELAMIVHPPRFVVFSRGSHQGAAEGIGELGAIAQLTIEPSQVQAAKARMLRKVQEARTLLTASEEEQQKDEHAAYARAEAAALKDSGGKTFEPGDPNDHSWEYRQDVKASFEGWYRVDVELTELIDQTELAVGALGERATLDELKSAGRLVNKCVAEVSEGRYGPL